MLRDDIVHGIYKRQVVQDRNICGFTSRDKFSYFSRYLPNSSLILQKYKHKAFCSILNVSGDKLLTAAQDDIIRQYDLSSVSLPSRETGRSRNKPGEDPQSVTCVAVPQTPRACRYARRQRMPQSDSDRGENLGNRLHLILPNSALVQYRAQDVGWSVLDVAYSPDHQKFAYSSWSRFVHECDVSYGFVERPRHRCENDRMAPPSDRVHERYSHYLRDDEGEDVDTLDNTSSHARYHHRPLPFTTGDDPRSCIFSLAYSPDGREIIGGATDGQIHIFDKELNKTVQSIACHEDDVNGVAFANETSDVLLSGGDDGLIKVWDRRNLKEGNPMPVGIWAGHGHGVTYLDSKRDGRYVISNSKDQSIKLWDTRKFSSQAGQEETRKAVNQQNWDYRWQNVPTTAKLVKALIGDTSIQTYYGHVVLYTLIRCRFSPIHTTDQQYIVTGCASGDIIVYDVLTGKIRSKLKGHNDCVRDVSWHPYKPEIYSASWDGCVRCWSYDADEDILY